MLTDRARSLVWTGRNLFLLGSLLCACAAPAEAPNYVPARRAIEAFRLARSMHEARVAPDDPELWRALRSASVLAPDWIPPQRLEDDLLQAAHLEVEALERRRVELAREPDNANARYLAARLEADLDPLAFEEVLRLDPNHSWARHAWSFARSLKEPKNSELERDWRRALRQASTPWEAAYFTSALANYLDHHDAETAAFELFEWALADLELERSDRAWLTSELALFELRLGNSELTRRGMERALNLIRSDALGPRTLESLVFALEDSLFLDEATALQLELSLGAQESSARRELLVQHHLRRGDLELARLEFAQVNDAAKPRLRERVESTSVLFASGDFSGAMQLWLAGLPRQVLDETGLPRDRRLREVVEAARDLGAKPSRAGLTRLGEGLVAAGWYEEALQVARALSREDSASAESLRARALAGRLLFVALPEALGRVERERAEFLMDTSWDDALEPRPNSDVGSLNDLLRRWASAFALCATQQGRASSMNAMRADFENSPRQEYGPLAQLVHPGPLFSPSDARSGKGKAGETVKGLAQEMERHGRFAVVGEFLGAGGPDATVLRRVLVEQREGEHLGVRWSGTVAWCAGVDVESRSQRSGANIAGAALHEGYWIDLDEVRDLHRRWTALARQFETADDWSDAAVFETARLRIARVLDTRGLHLRAPKSEPRRRQRERTSIAPALGQSARVRLAVLRERAQAGALLGAVDLSEMVDLIAVHEEGHLCDRSRFLPIARHLGPLLIFFMEQGLSAVGAQRQLEYRAQLTALCSIADPRLALVDLLEAAEARSDGGLEHGPAYRQMLQQFIEELDEQLQEKPEAWPQLSTEHTLLHQLHRLSAEEVRRIALVLAKRESLVARGY